MPGLTRDYLLLWEAFDALGRHLYGPTWTGNELDVEKPPETYEQLVEAREPYEAERNALLEKADALDEERRIDLPLMVGPVRLVEPGRLDRMAVVAVSARSSAALAVCSRATSAA